MHDGVRVDPAARAETPAFISSARKGRGQSLAQKKGPRTRYATPFTVGEGGSDTRRGGGLKYSRILRNGVTQNGNAAPREPRALPRGLYPEGPESAEGLPFHPPAAH